MPGVAGVGTSGDAGAGAGSEAGTGADGIDDGAVGGVKEKGAPSKTNDSIGTWTSRFPF